MCSEQNARMEIGSNSSTLSFENASILHADVLTALTFRSKDHWKYGADQLMQWKEALTISPTYIETNEVIVLKHNHVIIGYYSYIDAEAFAVELDNLFIDPDYIGQGYGTVLMHHFLNRMKEKNTVKIMLYADPHAEQFYAKHGFKVIGEFESSQAGRYLPMMGLTINSIAGDA